MRICPIARTRVTGGPGEVSGPVGPPGVFDETTLVVHQHVAVGPIPQGVPVQVAGSPVGTRVPFSTWWLFWRIGSLYPAGLALRTGAGNNRRWRRAGVRPEHDGAKSPGARVPRFPGAGVRRFTGRYAGWTCQGDSAGCTNLVSAIGLGLPLIGRRARDLCHLGIAGRSGDWGLDGRFSGHNFDVPEFRSKALSFTLPVPESLPDDEALYLRLLRRRPALPKQPGARRQLNFTLLDGDL